MIFDNQYEQLRIQKAKELKEAGITPTATAFAKR